jgi:hypothetical protein
MAKFEEVLQEERKHLFGQEEIAKEPEGVGLAFSGGGIRSATFNLGILQGLAKANLLDKIHYISTVSGGGYIGGWLISWIKHHDKRTDDRSKPGTDLVQTQLGDFKPGYTKKGFVAEPEEISFLRDYSNYMTPRLGIFGADTWAAIATYLRNVLLNQLILIGFLGAIVMLPLCILTSSHSISARWSCLHNGYQGVWITGILAGFFLVLGVCWASWQSERSTYTVEEAPATAGQNFVLGFVVVPLFLSATFTMTTLWLAPSSDATALSWQYWVLIGAGIYAVPHVVGMFFRWWAAATSHDKTAKVSAKQWFFIPATAAVAGGIGGFLLEQIYKLIAYWKPLGHGFAHALTWGPAIFVGAFLLVGGLHIGLLKILIQNGEQEWWGRAGGLLMLICIGWSGLFALTIFVPWLFATQDEWIKTKVGAFSVWALTTAAGVISGKSSKTSGKGNRNSALEIVALVSPYVFIVGLLVLLSSGVYWLAENKWEAKDPAKQKQEVMAPVVHRKNLSMALRVENSTADGSLLTLGGTVRMEPIIRASDEDKVTEFWNELSLVPACRVWGYFFALLIGTVLVALRVDINIFSMNLLYRNRLVRCYLGASRPDCNGRPKPCDGRHPNPFTGFDPRDDTPLAEFRPEQGYNGPYPIVCAALNVTHGERLAWQERKAESFVFTPRYCGYEFSEMHVDASESKDKHGGYQQTEEYAYPFDRQNPFHSEAGGVHLGTAISISGAAASPNMGFHTSPPLAFLMTVFNVRLGWWLANSRYTKDEVKVVTPEGGPPFSLLYLLNELLASTTDQSDYVYLSDGGHFENLAVYELIRRRCKFIIACDGDADENVQFGDLGNLIRKCRSDLGVEIDLDVAALKPHKKTKFAKLHAVVGTIQYPGPDPDPKVNQGTIIYIKPTLTDKLPRDILAYSDTHPPFPYQTTADQWFDESQFESYRNLGQYTMDGLTRLGPNSVTETVEALAHNVREIVKKAQSKLKEVDAGARGTDADPKGPTA